MTRPQTQNFAAVRRDSRHVLHLWDPHASGLFDRESSVREQIALVILGSILLAVAVTKQSLWIDEAWTAWFAGHPSAKSLLESVAHTNGSEAQMPGYLLFMFAWVKLFARSEVAMRLANLPFAVLLLSSFSWVSTALLKRAYAWLIIALSPFLWFYMNEARPYVALMATSSVVGTAVLAYCIDQRRYHHFAPWVALSTFTVALAFHMLAAFIAVPLLLFLGLSMKGQWGRVFSDWYRPVLVFLPLIGSLLAYFVWTISRGAAGVRSETGLRNVAFVLYEFWGFGGLGPPRNDLRSNGSSVLAAYWPMLALGFASFLFILLAITIASHGKHDKYSALSLAIGFAIAILACRAAQFRFLGRHFAALYPFAFIILLMGTQVTGALPRRCLIVGALTLLALTWAISDARMLLLPMYEKEDYRSAARIALDRARCDGKPILWAADGVAAYYYGLQVDELFNVTLLGRMLASEPLGWPETKHVLLASNWSRAEVCTYSKRSGGAAILILGNKADLYDQKGGWVWLTRQPEAHAIRIATLNDFEAYEFSPDYQTSWCAENEPLTMLPEGY
jgi:hypothetical protein